MTPPRERLIVIDDDPNILSLLEDFLNDQGFVVAGFTSAAAFLDLIEGPSQFVQVDEFGSRIPLFDLVVSDIKMPGLNGFAFLTRFKKIFAKVPVVLATSFGSIDSAIEAMQLGAFNYVTKPFKLVEFRVTLERALQYRRLERDNEILRLQLLAKSGSPILIGKSKPMQDLFDLVAKVSKGSSNVLITGESGTGKEQVAKAIHSKSSRFEMPFIAVNCSATPDSLLESELFGHTQGGVSGAEATGKGLLFEANGGTLFFDEIGDLSKSAQAKLFRVIQDRKFKPPGQNQEIVVDVRIIATTQRDLKQAAREGNFREDLFYRLCVIPIVIPPLRQRPDDVALLSEHFLKQHAARNECAFKQLSPMALAKLMNLKFRGNVRELENILERALVLSQGDQIEVCDFDADEVLTTEQIFSKAQNELVTLKELESRYIEHVLLRTGGRKDRAAQILGVNRRSLLRWEQSNTTGKHTK